MTTLAQDIVFKIVTVYSPGMMTDLKSLHSMLNQIYGATRQYIDSAAELSDVQGRLSIDISKVNNNVRGLTGSLNLITEANRLSAANVKVNAEQFAILSKYAAVFADSTGRKTSDVLGQVVGALITGTERGLIPFGISVKDSADKTEIFNSAIGQMSEAVAGSEVGLDTIREKQEAWTDVIITATSKLIDSQKAASGLRDILLFGEYDPNAGILGWLQEIIYGSDDAVTGINNMLDVWNKTQGKMPAAPRADTMVSKYDYMTPTYAEWQKNYLADQQFFAAQSVYAPGVYEPPLENYKPPSGGGGGGGPEMPPGSETKWGKGQIVESFDERIEAMQREAEAKQIAMQNQEIVVFEALQREDEAKRIMAENSVNYTRYECDTNLDYFRLSYDQRLGIMHNFFASGANLMQLAQQYQFILDAKDEAAARKKHQTMKALWTIGKIATIGQIQIDAARAIMGTWASMAGLGIPGIVIGGVMTAFIAATAALQTAIVSAQHFEGGTNAAGNSISAAGALGSGGGGGGFGGSPSGYEGGGYGGGEKNEVVITIEMGDSAMFLDAVVDENDNAARSGRRYLARVR
jgi:hypothetical protein